MVIFVGMTNTAGIENFQLLRLHFGMKIRTILPQWFLLDAAGNGRGCLCSVLVRGKKCKKIIWFSVSENSTNTRIH
jgi:hypothetical protein